MKDENVKSEKVDKKVIEKLLSSSDVSHKRLISLLSFSCLVAILIMNAFGLQIDSNITYSFLGLCGGQSVLSVIDKFIK